MHFSQCAPETLQRLVPIIETFTGTGTSTQASRPSEAQLQLNAEDQHNNTNQKKNYMLKAGF